MNTTHIACRQCKRDSFLEDQSVFFCPYCGSNEINTNIIHNRSGAALNVMGFNKLNEEQKAVVLSTEGVNYVEAGPGTAKTTTLVFRTNYLIYYRQDGIHKPLILTFTNQAVDQLVRSFLNHRPQDRPQVATRHGFAFGRLHEFCDLLPYQFQDFRIMNEDDWNLFVDWNRTHNPAVDVKFSGAELKEIIRQMKRTDAYISALMEGKGCAEPVLSAFLNYQRENCMLDFDDLINALVWLMKKNPDVCSNINDRYRYVLVDESQDLTTAELELLDLMTLRYRNLFLVGDTDQSIYGWRGAQNRVRDWLESLGCKVHRFSLTLNYRSSQAVLDAAGSVIEAAPNRKPKKLVSVNPKGVKVMVKECPDPFHEAKIIASSIELAVDRTSQPLPLKYSDIAVLARNHASLRLIRKAMIKKHIPVSYDNEIPLLQRSVIQSIIRHLRFVDSPNYLTLSALDKPLVPEKFLPEFFDAIEDADGQVSEALFFYDDDDEDKLTPHGYWFERVLNAIRRGYGAEPRLLQAGEVEGNAVQHLRAFHGHRPFVCADPPLFSGKETFRDRRRTEEAGRQVLSAVLRHDGLRCAGLQHRPALRQLRAADRQPEQQTVCIRTDLRQRHGDLPVRDGGRFPRSRSLRQNTHSVFRLVLCRACRVIHDRPSAQAAPETDRLPFHP